MPSESFLTSTGQLVSSRDLKMLQTGLSPLCSRHLQRVQYLGSTNEGHVIVCTYCDEEAGGIPSGLVRLNLASGSDYRPGWINCDAVDWPGCPPPDVRWDSTSEKIPIPDASVSEIYMGYTLLHTLPRYRPALLREVWRVLAHRGLLVVGEVDMALVMARWVADPGDSQTAQLIWGELGEPDHPEMHMWDTHRPGYTETTLQQTLEAAGFSCVCRVRVHSPEVWYELTLRARKIVAG